MTRLYLLGLALLVGAVGYGIGFQVGTSHQIGAFRSYLGHEDVALDAVGERMRDILLWPDALERAEALGRFFKTLEPEALESVKRAYGTVSFDYGDVHFVALDTVNYLGRDSGGDAPHRRGKGSYEGRISHARGRWLAR